LIHIEDVAHAFATVMTATGPRHDIYNTGGEFATMEMLAAMLRESVPEAHIDLGPVADRQAHVRRVDWTRLREEFAIIRPSIRERIAEWLRAERESAVAL
jgi:nucleoside-diphosphate-sugar epimerase